MTVTLCILAIYLIISYKNEYFAKAVCKYRSKGDFECFQGQPKMIKGWLRLESVFVGHFSAEKVIPLISNSFQISDSDLSVHQ